MGPFLYVIAASACAVGAAASVGSEPPLAAGDVIAADLFACGAVFFAAIDGAACARRRVANEYPASAIAGRERLQDFVACLVLLFGTEFPTLVVRAVPGVFLDALVVFAPAFAAAAARHAAALRVDPEIASERRPFAPEFRLALRMLLAPVLPFLVLDALVSTAAAIPACTVAFAAYPSCTAATGVLAIVLGAAFSPLLLRVLFGARPLAADDPLRRDCEELAARARFPLDYLGRVETGMLLPNAAFLGMCRPWRTVLFTDALLAMLDPRERRAVFAHELGHGVRRHLWWFSLGLATSTVAVHAYTPEITAFATFVSDALLGAGLEREAAVASGEAAALVAATSAVLGALWLLFGALSRRFECEADLFASDVAGGPEPFAEALSEVAARVGVPERDGFRHFGTARRIAFVRRAAAEPAFRKAFERRMAFVRLVLVVLAVTTGLRWAAGFPAERSAAPPRAADALLELCDDALLEGDFAAAATFVAQAESLGAPADPRREVNRAHAAARLAALGHAGASETEFLAALDRLTAARRAFAEAEAVHGPLATPESVAETDHEIRFLEALSGRAPAEFDPDAFPAARWLAALRGGPEAVSPAAAAAARRECATDAAWRREALLRRVDVRAAAAARYPGLCDNDDG